MSPAGLIDPLGWPGPRLWFMLVGAAGAGNVAMLLDDPVDELGHDRPRPLGPAPLDAPGELRTPA